MRGAVLKAVLSAALRCRKGASAVEFALVAPILVAMLVALGDLGTAVFERMEVASAAQAGAQLAATKGWDAASIENAVTSASGLATITATPAPTQSCGCPSGGAITTVQCGSACPDGAPAGTYVTVNAQAQYSTIVSYPGLPNPLTLTGQAVMRIQ